MLLGVRRIFCSRWLFSMTGKYLLWEDQSMKVQRNGMPCCTENTWVEMIRYISIPIHFLLSWFSYWDNGSVSKPCRLLMQVEAMLDKTICALSNVFIGSSGSTFTEDIFRLRRGWGSMSYCDEYLCQGELPNYIAELEWESSTMVEIHSGILFPLTCWWYTYIL